MLKVQYKNVDYASTDCDSSEERDYDFVTCKTNPLKHKTELCKTYSQLGYCNYGDKCRFAHGGHQLIRVPKTQQLYQRKCKGFWGKCHCSYGVRCQFGHSQEKKIEDQQVMQIAKSVFGPKKQLMGDSGSKLMRIIQRN